MAAFDAGRYLARARRLADLSQRELAARSGVPQSGIAAIEAGRVGVDVRRLDRLLRAAGLRLAVVDASGEEVSPFPADAVRDRAGRRFPAHLDVQPPDRLPPEALGSPRYDREPPAAWHARRKRRDQERRSDPAAANDHPTPGQLQFRLLERRYGRTPSWPHRRVQVAESLGLAVEEALGD